MRDSEVVRRVHVDEILNDGSGQVLAKETVRWRG